MKESEIKYYILDESGNGEEFFVLIFGIDWHQKSELMKFLKMLVRLNELCHIKYTLAFVEKSELFTFNDLELYVDKRLKAGESLDGYNNICEEYCFTTTEKGNIWLNEQNAIAKERASLIIKDLDYYKETYKSYPCELNDLSQKHGKSIPLPFDGYGWWEYSVCENSEGYKIQFGAVPGQRYLYTYNSEKKTWDYENLE